jgi:hypothetical protein
MTILHPITVITFLVVLMTASRAGYIFLELQHQLDFHLGENCTRSTTDVPSRPQLQCLSGPCQDTPPHVICDNLDFPSNYTRWNCTPPFAEEGGEGGVTLGNFTIQCEEYYDFPYSNIYPDFVWDGSCALLYHLIPPSEPLDFSRF